MTEICKKEKCTGCFACSNICPKQCIEMREDEYGYIYPHIDEEKCIDCKLCQKTCPQNTKVEFKKPITAYAMCHKEERIEEVVKLVKLENRIKDKVSKYSLGMRQRLGIAQAILHRPNLLILDEPTNGLDPEGIKEMRELLVNLAKDEKMAILISSHNLAELDNLCNKVCIIKNGRIIETSDIDAIKKQENQQIKIIEVSDTKKVKELLPKAVILEENRFKIDIPKEEIPELIVKLVENQIKIYGVKEEEKSLEQAFFEKTGGNIIE